uniref:Sushi domain-containing protein n=1 Tax=Haemonchus contortus TaxID=6289 RepID=A0A7I4XVB9_HAECO
MMRFFICTVAIATLIPCVQAALKCPPVVAPLGGKTTFTGDAYDGTSVTATCSNGLIMNGAATLTCINGQWVPPTFGICTTIPGFGGAPGLRKAQCLPMLQPLGAILAYSSGETSTALAGLQDHGTTVMMRCNSPNALVSGPSVSTCVNGQWAPPTLGVCTAINASPLGAGGLSTNTPCGLGVVPPVNSHVIYSSSEVPYPEGSTATMICNPGYIASGPSVVSCRNGLFGLLGTCVRTTG